MDRVCRDERVAALELDVDHDEVVDVVQIIPYALLGEFAVRTADDNVARDSLGDLVRYVAGDMELAFVPADFDLLR